MEGIIIVRIVSTGFLGKSRSYFRIRCKEQFPERKVLAHLRFQGRISTQPGLLHPARR